MRSCSSTRTRQIKQAVVGSGNAEKAQVQLMMRSLLKLDGAVPADAADALAAAVCHALRGRARVLAAGGREPMIGFLKGRLAMKQPPMLMIDVNGVGYELEAPMSTFYGLPATGEPVALFTHLVVRDDAHILFGFGTDSERRLFRGLLKVSGVGPKIALGILSGASVEDFLRIIESGGRRDADANSRALGARPPSVSSSRCATACRSSRCPRLRRQSGWRPRQPRHRRKARRSAR